LLTTFGLFPVNFGSLLTTFGLFLLNFGLLLTNFGLLLVNIDLNSTESSPFSVRRLADRRKAITNAVRGADSVGKVQAFVDF